MEAVKKKEKRRRKDANRRRPLEPESSVVLGPSLGARRSASNASHLLSTETGFHQQSVPANRERLLPEEISNGRKTGESFAKSSKERTSEGDAQAHDSTSTTVSDSHNSSSTGTKGKKARNSFKKGESQSCKPDPPPRDLRTSDTMSLVSELTTPTHTQDSILAEKMSAIRDRETAPPTSLLRARNVSVHSRPGAFSIGLQEREDEDSNDEMIELQQPRTRSFQARNHNDPDATSMASSTQSTFSRSLANSRRGHGAMVLEAELVDETERDIQLRRLEEINQALREQLEGLHIQQAHSGSIRETREPPGSQTMLDPTPETQHEVEAETLERHSNPVSVDGNDTVIHDNTDNTDQGREAVEGDQNDTNRSFISQYQVCISLVVILLIAAAMVLVGLISGDANTASAVDLPLSGPTQSPMSPPSLVASSVPSSLLLVTPTKGDSSSVVTSSPMGVSLAPSVMPQQRSFPSKTPTTKPISLPTFGRSPSVQSFIPTVSPVEPQIPTRNPTSSPTATPTIIPTQLPTRLPTFLPTRNPTVAPTMSPTDTPTASPTIAPTILEPTPLQCFASNGELKNAVRDYVGDSSPNSLVARQYGHPIGTWCVGEVTDFSSVFLNKQEFNEDISAWDVSQARDMSRMFEGAWAFNQDIRTWSTSQVTAMTQMFAFARSFTRDISTWDVSNVRDFDSMFAQASAFNRNLGLWDVSSATNMNKMFFQAGQFDRNLCAWGEKLRASRPSVLLMFALTLCEKSSLFNSDPSFSETPGPFCSSCT